ncbi:hypothetical protein SUGI_0596180 [Cryptomeria japonica]|nr:hypothetical protein SUGI_0596180 [Cryptomeria japonica]
MKENEELIDRHQMKEGISKQQKGDCKIHKTFIVAAYHRSILIAVISYESPKVSWSERCSGGKKSEEKDNPKPCLHFALETSDDSQEKEDMVDVLVNVICPNLMETTAKGYDCILSVRISWSPVNSASWVPLQIGEHEFVEGEIIIEAIVEKSEVKQCGDAWKIIHEACSSLMGSLDTNRCIPYNINAIYRYFGISAAYYILLQRLCYSVNSIGSHVYKEHLILISNYMYNRSTSQDVEQRQRTSEEAQGTGWSVDQQADVSETSWTTPETRLKEAQAADGTLEQY